MKRISDAMAAHLAQATMTLCRLWKVTRSDGVVLYFTDHDEDVVYDDSVEPA